MIIRLPFLLLVAALLPGITVAQPAPGQNVQVSVGLVSVAHRGDTTGVTSTVGNLAGSQEQLFSFLIDAPSGVARMDRPTPARSWGAFKDFGGRPAAYWIVLELLAPGATTPALYYESVGLPGIVTFWAGGYYPLTGGEDNERLPGSPPVDPLTTEMINGKTVGVEPWPTNRTPQALLARLRSLTQTSCTTPLLWITNSSLCTQLTGDLDQAEAFRTNGQTAEAKGALDHFVLLLTGGTPGTFATGVSSSGYWLLKANAEIVKNAL